MFCIDFPESCVYNKHKGGIKMLDYKIDVLESLKEAGYTTTSLRKNKLLGENAIQAIRENKMIGINSLEKICKLLDMQPGNIIKYVEDKH